jgi:hypothetical protein
VPYSDIDGDPRLIHSTDLNYFQTIENMGETISPVNGSPQGRYDKEDWSNRNSRQGSPVSEHRNLSAKQPADMERNLAMEIEMRIQEEREQKDRLVREQRERDEKEMKLKESRLREEVQKLKDELDGLNRENINLARDLSSVPTQTTKDTHWAEGWSNMESTYKIAMKNKQKDLNLLDQEFKSLEGELHLSKAELSHISQQKVNLLEVSDLLEKEVNKS